MKCYYCCDPIAPQGNRVQWNVYFFHPLCFLKWVARIVWGKFRKNRPFDEVM